MEKEQDDHTTRIDTSTRPVQSLHTAVLLLVKWLVEKTAHTDTGETLAHLMQEEEAPADTP